MKIIITEIEKKENICILNGFSAHKILDFMSMLLNPMGNERSRLQ